MVDGVADQPLRLSDAPDERGGVGGEGICAGGRGVATETGGGGRDPAGRDGGPDFAARGGAECGRVGAAVS